VIAAREHDRFFTPAEYFAWEEQQLEKHELIDGRVYAMSGGTKNHSEIAGNFLSIVKPYLRRSGCKTYNSDCRVNIFNTSNYLYPDLRSPVIREIILVLNILPTLAQSSKFYRVALRLTPEVRNLKSTAATQIWSIMF
jgi:Putative restriction endonuclease